jgi:cytochrome c556
VPVAANTVAANPDAYYGQPVTLTAVVERILSKSAFVVAQRTVAGVTNPTTRKDLLVLVPTITGAVDQNAYVTVFGEVVRFDPAEIAKKAKDYKLDLAPEVVAEYSGRPAVVATGVLNAAMIDLAKRLPPPMTPDEEVYSKVMKRVAPALAELRKGIEASTADVTTKNAAVLKQAFTEVEAFWKKRGKADATDWAQGARKQAELIEKTVASAKWDEVKASATTLGQACQTCHTAYRERFDDGSFRIKNAGR